jgi:hypothetical protein
MKLLEFFYFSDKVNEFVDDKRYTSENDKEVVEKDDTRKIRLTLGQINQLRKQSEAHQFEQKAELEFIRQMYGQPAVPAEQQQ